MQLWLEQFWRDIRFGVRHLAKAPAVSILAVVSLGAGIMATTAIYSVLHAVVLDPFPYKDVDRLMSVRVSNAGAARRPHRLFSRSVPRDRRPQHRSSTASSHRRSATSCGPARRAAATARQSRHLQHLRRDGRPAAHRPDARRPTTRRPGATPVVVLGYRFWQRQFGGDPECSGGSFA